MNGNRYRGERGPLFTFKYLSSFQQLIKLTIFLLLPSWLLGAGALFTWIGPTNPIIPRTWFLIEKSSSERASAADVFHRCHRQGPFINPRFRCCKNCPLFWKRKFHWSKHDAATPDCNSVKKMKNQWYPKFSFALDQVHFSYENSLQQNK